ncbi:MAG: hypothetical protein WCG15_01920 [Actinomycetes bacterium]
MPVSPQITITPEDITFKSFDITVVSYTSSTATYTATGHTLSAGDIVTITGIAPDGYNGTYTISSVATNTFTIANATNTALTDQAGNVYWADATEYEYSGGQTVTYRPNDGDVSSIIDNNATVANAAAQAASAASAASTAQSTANTALTNAATAYTTAQNSLQPSAYAIQNPTTKQLSSIDATGLTVYSGASATSGARVVLNSTGLAGYNSGGSATFSISASTGAAVFSGSVTGATITASTMNIGGNAIIDSSGLLTATGATITGTVNATAGYFGTSSNGFSINSTGMIGVGGGVISGGIITTSTGSNAVVLDGPNNALGIKYGGTYAGWLVGIGSGAFMMHYGSSPSTVGYPRSSVSSTTASMAADGSNSLSITTSGNNMQGSMTFGGIVTMSNTLNANSYIYNSGYPSTTGAANMRINTSSGLIAYTSSSARYKVAIEEQAIPGASIFSLTPKSYVDKVESEEKGTTEGLQRWIGLIAEDVAQIPVLKDYLVEYNTEGEPNSVYYDRVGVALIPALKELNNRLLALEGK